MDCRVGIVKVFLLLLTLSPAYPRTYENLSKKASVKNWICYQLKPDECSATMNVNWCNANKFEEADCNYEDLLQYVETDVKSNNGVYNTIKCVLACPEV
ncbi:uncharacterized protein LOC111703253 isoform X3 [Eurytemora carolleeae]|uniref:uncharacterized protein LOC111703253 isoform X2 n=1 Tax=Eurytemora carolleeae TaxID=1294199 RepID=UPI000C785784|nr:uncharacterized protein LOC111703253 isoform X2 [Eurytemora carolleeae]XP_023330914.1 uncharacterized protein LOC111703253 isoform X3 [Eurytemora carolleeae]|eukprot:XP_023330913.1 uncharacterized protein LOC111703253 isoform X2 [Eurytemora affinis]